MAFAENTVTEQGKQPYKYNGKESDQMHGLNMYDYLARFYEPAIGRFSTLDPHSESYYAISPYVYGANNPILNIDPDGRDYWSTNDRYQIQKFLQTLNSNGGIIYDHDLNTWETHLTDKEFFSAIEHSYGLTYNDETGRFYSSEWSVENGEIVVTGVSAQASGIPGMLPVDKLVRPYVPLVPQSGRIDGLGLVDPIFNVLTFGRGWALSATRVSSATALTTKGGIELSKSFGKLGTTVAKPSISISNMSTHAVSQATARGVSESLMKSVVSNPGVVLQQSNGTFLYLTKDAAVVLNSAGRVVTTYPARMFDVSIKEIVKLL